jgi:hypothetical protein
VAVGRKTIQLKMVGLVEDVLILITLVYHQQQLVLVLLVKGMVDHIRQIQLVMDHMAVAVAVLVVQAFHLVTVDLGQLHILQALLLY